MRGGAGLNDQDFPSLSACAWWLQFDPEPEPCVLQHHQYRLQRSEKDFLPHHAKYPDGYSIQQFP